MRPTPLALLACVGWLGGCSAPPRKASDAEPEYTIYATRAVPSDETDRHRDWLDTLVAQKETTAFTLHEVEQNPEKFVGHVVRVTGTVTQVQRTSKGAVIVLGTPTEDMVALEMEAYSPEYEQLQYDGRYYRTADLVGRMEEPRRYSECRLVRAANLTFPDFSRPAP